MPRAIVITGVAGFIGSHLAEACSKQGWQVLGVDNLNDYYSVKLKEDRLARLMNLPGFTFMRQDVAQQEALREPFAALKPDAIIHLAAQPGVHQCLTHPQDYIHNNILATFSMLELARHCEIPHLIYASSSAVYGSNKTVPFHTGLPIDQPLNLYAATKASCELMAHSYAHLCRFATTGLRFFTVYGPWGRPDMAIYKFTRALYEGTPIQLNNNGDMWRDYTYVDDIVTAIIGLAKGTPEPGRAAVFNIGNHTPVSVNELVDTLESLTGRTAHRLPVPFQPAEMHTTHADVSALQQAIGFAPDTPIREGLAQFVEWYKGYHGVA
jgi:UDP-glucuronate 4-epimerase